MAQVDAATNKRAPGRPRTVNDPSAERFGRHRVERIERLVPYGNNPRTHSPAQIARIAASIEAFGFVNPILVDGKRGVIAGHGRLLAAQKLRMEAVPVIELSHLSAAQKQAYVIADNKLALDAGWDEELLVLELGELRDAGFDLGLTGFDGRELDALFGEGNEGLTDPDEEETATLCTCPKCGHSHSFDAQRAKAAA
jgi:ParB-like chromosome segregation protein Spo0J